MADHYPLQNAILNYLRHIVVIEWLEIKYARTFTRGVDLLQFLIMQIEGSVVHIMKALGSHPSAAQSLIEDNSLELLFQMVANGSLTVFSQYKDGLVPLHTIQLHRHAMQVNIYLLLCVLGYICNGRTV